MANPGATAALNAILWGSGYLYAGKGSSAVLLVFAHIVVYVWAFSLGLVGWLLVMGPIFLFVSIYLARDGYRYVSSKNPGSGIGPKAETKSTEKKGFCNNCGARISASAKFCSACGASQSE